MQPVLSPNYIRRKEGVSRCRVATWQFTVAFSVSYIDFNTQNSTSDKETSI